MDKQDNLNFISPFESNKNIQKVKRISSYAPVVIPTLNRYNHFKRCFESLEKCTGADKTILYVGLDYPPSEKYRDGWYAIDAYLHTKEKNNMFQELIVIRRPYNYGVGGENSNARVLFREVFDRFDRCIFTEDDNEFSPNFLEFMNQGLEKYENDNHVIRISAYTSPIFAKKVQSTTFMGIDTPAYGLGIWKNKEVKAVDINIGNYLKSLSFRKYLQLFFIYPSLFSMVIDMERRKTSWGDVICSLNNLLFGTFTLQPSLSLARNWGNDGSGINCGKNEKIENEIIDTNELFYLEDVPLMCPKEIKCLYRYRNMPSNPFKYPFSVLIKLYRAIRFYFA